MIGRMLKIVKIVGFGYDWLATQIAQGVNRACDVIDRPPSNKEAPAWQVKYLTGAIYGLAVVFVVTGLATLTAVLLALWNVGLFDSIARFLFCPSGHSLLSNIWQIAWHWMVALAVLLFYLILVLAGQSFKEERR